MPEKVRILSQEITIQAVRFVRIVERFVQIQTQNSVNDVEHCCDNAESENRCME